MNIAITGAGIVSAIGLNKQEVLHSLLAEKSGIGEMRHLQSTHHELPVGEVDLSNEQMKAMLSLPADKLVSRTALLGMLAVGQAVEEARVRKQATLRIWLVSGTTVGGMDMTERYFSQLDKIENREVLDIHDCGSCTRQMAEHFDLFDEMTTLSTACSSAANAILLGARMIQAGEADIVVAGGTEALSKFHLNGFNSLMILDKDRCRPFDATRAGLNLGEGAAFVVLESEQLARQRGVAPLAYLTGYGNACDAFHQTASSANGEGAYLAMKQALEMARLSPADIHYVNAHGTGTPNNDESESVALKRVFGDRIPRISSTKSFTGHTTSASGSIETVISILAMQHHFVPANLGWKNQMPEGITPSSGERNVFMEHVLCNSFGFGGNDTALLLSSSPSNEPIDTTFLPKSAVRLLAKVEITLEEELAEIRNFVKPMEARRMGKLMKSSLLSSLKALKEAGIEVPDAIVTGTSFGCLENSEVLLKQLETEGEEMLKPTCFMQSTHNTMSSNIAIKTKCHGYNVTYTQGGQSLDWAVRDAEWLLRSGACKRVLVGCHDETTPLFSALMKQKGEEFPSIRSISMVLSCGE